MPPLPSARSASGPSKARGRPRSEDRTTAILDAAVEVLHEQGWSAFRVQDVAERANAGLATIYRRWRTREDLIAAALCHDAPLTLKPSKDPRRDLRRLVVALADKLTGDRGRLVGVLTAAADHPQLSTAIDVTVRQAMRPLVRAHLSNLLGEEHHSLDLVTDAIFGVLIVRAEVLRDPTPSRAFASEVVALVDTMTIAQM